MYACTYTVLALMSIHVDLATSKIAITSANNVRSSKFLYALTRLKLGFTMICITSLYSDLVKC